MKKYNVAVVGATGLVGRKMVQVLEERRFPINTLLLLASSRSTGKIIYYCGKPIEVNELKRNSFSSIEIALFSAGGTVSKEFAPLAANAGALVIDNSSAFRMDPDVPLVVPEVNSAEIRNHKGIIANPNCSTIQMVVALKPLHDKWKVRRIIVSTYQSVTGAGKYALDQLQSELSNVEPQNRKFPHQIAMNVIPQVDIFTHEKYTREEMKMVNETKKILDDNSLLISATCARVPVISGHSESVNIEFENPFSLDDVLDVLGKAPGIKVLDDDMHSIYPMPILSHEKDEVFVGRIRRDDTLKNGINMWIVADNLRKGAATNAVQIAEEYIKHR
jgi:aspartate-semialdehyde dehydrogenase